MQERFNFSRVSRHSRREVHFFVAVWGPWYVDTFLKLNLGTLLSAGNLPDMARKFRIHFYISTSQNDASTFNSSPMIARLRDICEVHLNVLPNADFGRPIETQIRLWRETVENAKARHAYLCPFPSDMVWADGSFRTVAKLLAAGKKAIYAMFPRVVDETFRAAFGELQNVTRPDGVMSLPPRDLVAMALRHIHPFHCAYLRSSRHFPAHAEYVYWPVEDEGLLMRVMATTVLIFDTVDLDVDTHFSIKNFDDFSEVAFIEDSDDLFGASITPLKKDWSWYVRPHRLDIDDLGRWWVDFDGAAHLELSCRNFRFHVGDCDERKWTRAQRAGDFTMLQAHVSRGLISAVIAADLNSCTVAARVLSTALSAGRLRRHWRWKSPFIAFVPSDLSMTSDEIAGLERLLTPGQEVNLCRFLLDHVVQGKGLADLTARSRDAATLGGRLLRIESLSTETTINGSPVISEIRVSADLTLCIVGSPIWPTVQPAADLSHQPEQPMIPAAQQAINTALAKVSSIWRVLVIFGSIATKQWASARRAFRSASSLRATQGVQHSADAIMNAENHLFRTLAQVVCLDFVNQVGTAVPGNALLESFQSGAVGQHSNMSVVTSEESAPLRAAVSHVNGLVECIRGNHVRSVEWFSAAIASSAVDGWAWFHVGVAQLAGRQKEQAISSFSQALERLPNHQGALVATGHLLRQRFPWLAAAAYCRANVVSPDIVYPIPTLMSVTPTRFYCGQYRDFNIYWGASGFYVAYPKVFGHCDYEKLRPLTTLTHLFVGLVYFWRSRNVSPAYSVARGATVGMRPSAPRRSQGPSLAFRVVSTISRWKIRLLEAIGQRGRYPNFWEFAIVASSISEIICILDLIDQKQAGRRRPKNESSSV